MKAAEPAVVGLADPVQFLPGVGPRRAAALGRLGIATVADLLEHFPARHERQEERTIEHLDEGMVASIVGQVTALRVQGGRRGRRVSATLQDNTGRCSLCWFGAPWVADQIQPGAIVRATGKVTEYRRMPQLVNPRIVVLGEDAQPADEASPARLEAVYPATAELPSRALARLIGANLDRMLSMVREWHPAEHLRRRGLAGRQWSLRAMHRPAEDRDLEPARRRLAYDELLLMQIAVALARRGRESGAAAPRLPSSAEIDERIRRRLPFDLTPGQAAAVREIAADLGRARPMHRLLQGDVGCGKTVVALYAALVAVANRHQAAIMAPTELLAEQHYRSIERYLAGSRVRFDLLIGGLGAGRRREVLERIEAGEIDLVVGTHALVQEDVRFARLGLVVVDEQHRFGVRQRATIRSKGPAPHYLLMTATPIPRTLAMTVFGDLDVTTIDGLPPGRSAIRTMVVPPGGEEAAWEFARGRLREGEQAYVVYPLIDESDQLEVRAATAEHRRLSGEIFRDWPVGLLHGRQSVAQRDEVMRAFAAGRLRVLVATTVVEVGIDVAGATCMIIQHAERYGLSQLHQLRGRVGRGGRRGYCFLMTGGADRSEGERLEVLSSTTDGFRIAEEDLRLRGPGALMGTRQHGLPDLRMADLMTDGELLRLCRQDAAEILRGDPGLQSAARAELRAALKQRYGGYVDLAGVG